jgi:hypothetical protein
MVQISSRNYTVLKCKMRNAGAILFISVYLFSYTEVHEIFSLPAFFEHYHEHRTTNPEIGLLGYIKIHYTKSGETHEHDNHDSLPFKDDHCLQGFSINPIYFSELLITEFFNNGEYRDHHSVYNPRMISWLLHFSIWQPPRF